ncbi:MAG: DUF5320 domain-containing protein [Candidatus Methanofastidiosa archaeon]|jgi:hypothetical protein|nr:DUF5320 domain-containing protein [Candidatus Methanofastidiosa archaeon]HOM95335.1 DUF5320 domain-containing protein [Methanofastidiosum sp.]HPC80786.1 DUF5320 domain-containing protein [Methanofastidiosum sp.]HRS25078.1 DUF5320 domain-containing protein [Methanofastidiosum sp.]
MWNYERMNFRRMDRARNFHGEYGHGIHRRRRFFTKEERIQMLEDYKIWLEKERQGVEERIEELKKTL